MEILIRCCQRALWAFMLAALLIAGRAQVFAEASTMTLNEQKIKAGLVYNFLKYSTWPEDAFSGSRHLQVCLLGGDPFDGYLNPLQNRTAQQFVIDIVLIRNVEDAAKCHFVFIDKSLTSNLGYILKFLRGKPVLIASDIGHFSSQGGMVEFGMKDQRVQLYINKDAVLESGVSIENRLLKLAEVVR